MTGVDPHIEHMEAWVSAGVRRTVPREDLSAVFGPTYEQVAGLLGAAGVGIAGPAYAEYFGMPTDTVDVEIGFGVGASAAIDGLVVREHPETRAVVGTHVGPYDELPGAYGELMPWLEMEEHELAPSMYELYLSEPDEEPAKTVTKLVFPVA
ncbi:MAG: GyrI-like domain-containing protein [Actinobacteria bacterium]|nr:GyrI-like domain-containing protein [Actinomycetota bacterium]